MPARDTSSPGRPQKPHKSALEEIELDLLTEAIYRYRDFDFRDYARESLYRRVTNLMELENLPTISALQEKVLHEKNGDGTLFIGNVDKCNIYVS